MVASDTNTPAAARTKHAGSATDRLFNEYPRDLRTDGKRDIPCAALDVGENKKRHRAR